MDTPPHMECILGGFHKCGYPKSSMLIGFSLVNHPNASIYGNPFRSRMIILYNIDLGESEWRMEKVFMEVSRNEKALGWRFAID